MLATLAILAVIYFIKWQTDPVGCNIVSGIIAGTEH